MISAFNTISNEAYVYLEIEKVKQSVLQASIDRTGATGVIIDTFSRHEQGKRATINAESAAALFLVHSYARKHGFTLIEQGVASVQPREMQPANGGEQASITSEDSYDIVKKRKVIDHANLTVGSDVTDILLGEEAEYFYEFSDAVMGAFKTLSTFEANITNHEIKWMQQDHQCNAKTRIGYSYAAINLCLGDPIPIKIGATMKDSPFHRLKELSSCLPQSFELLACVPSTDPFAVEKLTHAHFAEFRIKKKSTGKNTEFFMVSKEVVCEYFAKLNQELLLPA